MALVAGLIRDEESFRAEAARATEALMRLMSEDVALGLSGPQLRAETKARLESEAKRERWESGKNEGNANLDRFTSDLERRLEGLPLVTAANSVAIVGVVKEAWEALWYPAPTDAADEYLHPALSGNLRAQTIERLEAIDRRSGSELAELVSRFRTAVETAEAKKRERLQLEQNAPEAEALSARLKDASSELGKLREQRDEAVRALTSIEGQLAAKRQELGRHVDKIGRGAPALRRAQYADRASALLTQLLEDAVPSEVGAVAREMTSAWKSMAHMSDRVDHIEITADCEVRMISKNGEDLHTIEKSAGASQVFTQALIAAITRVSGITFPFIVDTPLARLSREQRLGVLRTFTQHAGQVILLSTDEEVVEDKLDAIIDRISKVYELKVSHDDGVSVTTIHEGYSGTGAH